MHPHLNTRITYLNTLIRLSAPFIAYLITLSRLHILIHALLILIPCPTIPYLNTLSRTTPYLNTLSRSIPYLDSLTRTIPYLNTLSRTIPYLNTLSRSIPYLDTLNRTIPYLNTLSRTIPYLKTLSRIHSDFGNSSRHPIRIEYYVTQVVSQSESSITSLGSQ